jgi:hypothetical protein
MEAISAGAANQDEEAPRALRQAIEQRARELYEQRGRVNGHQLEDWLQAEAEVTQAMAPRQERRPASIVVRVGDLIYTGEYDAAACGDYTPGNLKKGQPITVLVKEDKLLINLPGGGQLVTTIVKKESA